MDGTLAGTQNVKIKQPISILQNHDAS